MPDFEKDQASNDNAVDPTNDVSVSEQYDKNESLEVNSSSGIIETINASQDEIHTNKTNSHPIGLTPIEEEENSNQKNKPFIPRMIHDVNINLGKNTFYSVIIIAVAIVVCVFVIECNPIKKDNDTISLLTSEVSTKNTPASYNNDEERWDAENGLYSNFKYGISFNLPKEMTWQKISGQAEHTVVKFLEPDLQLAIFVNINPLDIENLKGRSITEDIWDNYDQMVKMMSQIQKNLGNQTAEKVVNYNYRKAEICGKHAIKSLVSLKNS